jgi:hypothetical protein
MPGSSEWALDTTTCCKEYSTVKMKPIAPKTQQALEAIPGAEDAKIDLKKSELRFMMSMTENHNNLIEKLVNMTNTMFNAPRPNVPVIYETDAKTYQDGWKDAALFYGQQLHCVLANCFEEDEPESA